MEITETKGLEMLNVTRTLSWVLAEHCTGIKIIVLTTLLGLLIKAGQIEEKLPEIINCLMIKEELEELPVEMLEVMKTLTLDDIPQHQSLAMFNYLRDKTCSDAFSALGSSLLSCGRNSGMSKEDFAIFLTRLNSTYIATFEAMPDEEISSNLH